VNGAGAQEAAYAGLGHRSLAFLIDSLAWIFLLVQIAANIPQQTYEDEPVVVGVIFLALFSVAFNYFWLTEWKWGKTLGKAVVSIHVTSEDGARVAFGPATVRNLMRLVDLLLIGPILIATSSRRQRLGDRFAHTVVVRDQPARAAVSPGANPGPRAAPNPVPRAGAAPGPAAAAAPPAPAAPPPPAPVPATAAPVPEPPTAPAAPTRRSSKSVGVPEGGWRPIHVLWGSLATIAAASIEAALVAAFDPDLDSVAAILAVQALLAGTLIAVAVGFAARSTSLVDALGALGLRRFARSALGAAALTYLAYIAFAAIYAALVQPQQEDVTRDLGFDEGGLAAVLGGVLIVAVAPLSEEIFFRGFMFGGLRRRFPLWAAAAISGAVFGLLHYTGPDSIGVVPQLAVLGILLAWLYERTGSLWPPIMLHVVNNSLALVYLLST
jgi:uncharacterized protein